MQSGGRGRGRRGGFSDPGRMGDGNGLAFGFDSGMTAQLNPLSDMIRLHLFR